MKAITFFFLLHALSAADASAQARPEVRGVNIDPSNPWASPSPETLSKLGIGRVRFVYKGSHDSVAEALDRYTTAGVRVLLVLNNETGDVVGASFPPQRGPDFDWSDFRFHFLHSVISAATRAKRFGDLVSYQVWNEQNVDGSEVPPEVFGPLAKEAASLIRLTHPGARITLGSLLHQRGGPEWLESAEAAAPGLFAAFDTIGIHTYAGAHAALEDYPAILSRDYARLGRPISVTEWGHCGLTPGEAGSVMRRYLEALDRTAVVSEAYYFGWSEIQSPGCNYGLSEPREQQQEDGELFALRQEMASAFQADGRGPAATSPGWARSRGELSGWQDWERASAGGLLAAEAALRFLSNDPSLDRIDEIKRAAQARDLWGPGGMKGPRAQETLLRTLGVEARLIPMWVEPSRASQVQSLRRLVEQALAEGRPVILSTSKYYYFIGGATAEGKLLVDSGREEDLAELVREGGAVNAVLLPG